MSGIEFLGTSVPERAIIGLLSEDAAALSRDLQGVAPEAYARDCLLVDYALENRDPLYLLRARRDLTAARRRGATILIASWNEELLRGICDEIWWIHSGKVAAQGDPAETLVRWRAHIAARWREEQTGVAALMEPSLRGGDGRAAVLSVELLNASGQPVLGWNSGDPATISVEIHFVQPVEDPVVGLLLRTRIGLNVYGTNTELEKLKLGPRKPGDKIRVLFHFRCDLCPGEFTATVASHDPDGVWHEWLEDVVAFTVADTRYTAGVANLRARVEWALY